VFVAVDRFLSEEGLEGEIQYGVQNGRELALKGEVDFIAAGVGRGARLEPSGMKLIAQHETRATTHTLMVRPGIESVSQISSLVMMTGIGQESDDTALDRELKNILRPHGIELDQSDIGLVRVDGGHPSQYQALMEGIGDGSCLGAPYWVFLLKEGYRNLGCEADSAPGYGCGGILASSQKIAQNPDEVQAFVRAYVKAVRFCRDNPEETMQLMLKYSADWGVEDESTAREMYRMLSPYWDERIDPAVIERLLERTSQLTGKPIEPIESVLDTRFLDEALRTI
jgi:ABC-type nitrate/sulfonate/bicarbonate transport system substrate-binding protein